MPGIPKRDRKNPQPEKEPIVLDADEIALRLNKEPLTVLELTEYLNKKILVNATIDVKTVKNRISYLCEKSNGVLSASDFKRGKRYIIPPQCHGLILSLVATSLFDDRMDDSKLATKSLFDERILENIEKCLNDEDKEYIRMHPAYLTANLESSILKRINIETASLFQSLYHMDAAIRWRCMADYLDALSSIRCIIQRKEAKLLAAKLCYTSKAEDKNLPKQQKTVLNAENLDELIMALIAERIHCTESECTASEAELSNDGKFIAAYLLSNIFGYESINDDDVKSILDNVDVGITNSTRYKAIDEKAKAILDLSNPFERNIYDMLMFYTKMTFLTDYVYPEEYQNMQRFMENTVKYNMADALKLFAYYDKPQFDEKGIKKFMEKGKKTDPKK